VTERGEEEGSEWLTPPVGEINSSRKEAYDRNGFILGGLNPEKIP